MRSEKKIIQGTCQAVTMGRPQPSFLHATIPILLTIIFLAITPPLSIAQDVPETPAPFDPKETQHGFSQFDTMPMVPGETQPDPMPYYDPSQQQSSQLLDQSPKGLFLEIVTAESFEEDLEFRRGHLYYPISPTDHFTTDALAVFVVFRVFKHYAPYQVIGRLFPEDVTGLPSDHWTDEDAAYLALEDESGYLKLFPPSDEGWKPGRYRVDIFVGYEANTLNQMGTLHFTVSPRS